MGKDVIPIYSIAEEILYLREQADKIEERGCGNTVIEDLHEDAA